DYYITHMNGNSPGSALPPGPTDTCSEHGSCFLLAVPSSSRRRAFCAVWWVPLLLEVRAMYSVVLLMALTGGADAPAYGCDGGCFGGGCYGGCDGGGCAG